MFSHPVLCRLHEYFLTLIVPQSSLSVLAVEAESSSVIILNVVRERGTFGQVRVSWQVTGDHNDGEVIPSTGEVRHYKY